MSVWIEAARPKTLSAAIAPVVVGTAAASGFIVWRFLCALVVSLSLQIGVNFANDYFDGLRGVDTDARLGPRRAVASGLVTPARMRTAMLASFGVSGAAGLALAAAAGWELLIIGAAAFVAALAYSGGPRPYASRGLGEVSVFLFFGLAATAGSAYVQDERIVAAAVVSSIPLGLLASAILVTNNLRDLPTDAAAGKRTLAVRLGPERTRTLYRALALGGFPFLPVIAGLEDSPWPMLPFLALPLAVGAVKRVAWEGRALVGALTATARLHMIFGVLLATGLWIS